MSSVPIPAEAPPEEPSEDAVLGGRLRLKQPRRGHRIGHDAILLAAACPARAGERLVELGAGVGAAGLALVLRVEGTQMTLVEIDAELAALAEENARRNGLAARVRTVALDVAAPARAFAAVGLEPESVMRVLMNPPFNDPGRHRPSPDRRRRLAHAGAAATLPTWIRAAARLLRPHGTLTMIWRAAGLADVLRTLDAPFGAVAVLPVYPKPAAPAVRVLVRATKASRAPFTLLPPLVLNDRAGVPTGESLSVLRRGAALPLADV